MAAKSHGGRPSKYDKSFCNRVLEVGEEGGWLSEMADACNVHRATLLRWSSAHAEFSEALSRAKQKAQAWFERQGRLGLTDDKFNGSLWARQMSARHPDEYSEKRVIKTAGTIRTEHKPQRALTAKERQVIARSEHMAEAEHTI